MNDSDGDLDGTIEVVLEAKSDFKSADEAVVGRSLDAANDSDPTGIESSESLTIYTGTRVLLVGRFGGMNQREAANVIRSFGMMIVESNVTEVDWVVIGADESPLSEADLLPAPLREAAASGKLELIHETELWQRLGLVEVEESIRRYYTPVMLANLLGVSVSVIRRWHRRGLITAVRTMHRLPYFDFQEVATARRLAQWIASGASPKAIEQRLVDLVEVLPDIQRPLDQLSILIEGRHVLLRKGEGLIEPGGQLRFDFDALVDEPGSLNALFPNDDQCSPAVLSIFDQSNLRNEKRPSPGPLLKQIYEAEDDGELHYAIDLLHVLLGREGSTATRCFHLAELLYRTGELGAARERYYCAIELDPQFVEARMGLGMVLAEQGQPDLAASAIRGALSLHEDYAEAHYWLAKIMDDQGDRDGAREHWESFIQLAPESPWAGEAAQRLDESSFNDGEHVDF